MQNREPMGICCMTRETQTSNNLEGLEGEGGGRGVQVGGNVGKPVAVDVW